MPTDGCAVPRMGEGSGRVCARDPNRVLKSKEWKIDGRARLRGTAGEEFWKTRRHGVGESERPMVLQA